MVKNRTIFTGDNLDIMRGMNSASVDLIYLDPPFNSNRNYSAPVGSKAAGAAFKDACRGAAAEHVTLIADPASGPKRVGGGVSAGKGRQP